MFKKKEKVTWQHKYEEGLHVLTKGKRIFGIPEEAISSLASFMKKGEEGSIFREHDLIGNIEGDTITLYDAAMNKFAVRKAHVNWFFGLMQMITVVEPEVSPWEKMPEDQSLKEEMEALREETSPSSAEEMETAQEEAQEEPEISSNQEKIPIIEGYQEAPIKAKPEHVIIHYSYIVCPTCSSVIQIDEGEEDEVQPQEAP